MTWDEEDNEKVGKLFLCCGIGEVLVLGTSLLKLLPKYFYISMDIYVRTSSF
jgi:hypothetical protein